MRLGERRFRRLLGATAAAVLLALAVFTACSSEQTTSFGAPGSLDLRQFPDPPDAPNIVCEGSIPGPKRDGGCGVSWSTTIFPKMQATGVWKCGDGTNCHGPGSSNPSVAPLLVASDPDTTYTNFTTYTLKAQAYVATGPGAGSPDASAILCDMRIGSLCTSAPMPLGQSLTCTQDVTDLLEWLGCGAPNN